MKSSRTIQTDLKSVSQLVQKLADEDAGRPARPGMKYKKTLQGQNGKPRKVKVIIEALEEGLYSVSFNDGPNHTLMTWSWTDSAPDRVQLTYEETTSCDRKSGALNQKISEFLYTMSARRQIESRLDAFEKLLKQFNDPRSEIEPEESF